MKATIYDVAREAGVSIATVSKVINNKGKISQERRREIFAIMEKFRYQPSVIASALTGKHTYTLGLLIPDIANPFFGEVARAVEDRGHQLGYSVIICSTDNKEERVEQYISVLKKKQVDGIIIGTGMRNAEMLRDLSDSMAIVAIGRELPGIPVHTVVAHDWQGGYSAAEHLLEQGHRLMAVLSENLMVSSNRERVLGFQQRLLQDEVILQEQYVRTCKHRIEDGKREAALILRGEERPTAIFCCNDLLAVGALQAAKEAGLKVPTDLSIIGFDNTLLASVTDPPLTSVAQPMEHMGAAAVDLLLEQFVRDAEADSADKQRMTLGTELIIRQSTASVPLIF